MNAIRNKSTIPRLSISYFKNHNSPTAELPNFSRRETAVHLGGFFGGRLFHDLVATEIRIDEAVEAGS